jgi:hypothetical protein
MRIGDGNQENEEVREIYSQLAALLAFGTILMGRVL